MIFFHRNNNNKNFEEIPDDHDQNDHPLSASIKIKINEYLFDSNKQKIAVKILK